MSIFLVGMPGAGKTYFGKRLSEYLNVKFMDTDEIIQEKYGETVQEIFSKNGEKYFRKIESETLNYCLSLKEEIVCSTGGGIVESAENRRKLKIVKTIYIKKSIEELKKRLERDMRDRPLFGEDRIKKLEILFERRRKLYEEFIPVEVPSGEISDAVIKVIMNEINNEKSKI